MQSFKNVKKRNATVLSKTLWNAKESGLNPTINWKIINQVIPYKPGQKVLQLMLNRKVRNTTSKPTNNTQQKIGTYPKMLPQKQI